MEFLLALAVVLLVGMLALDQYQRRTGRTVFNFSKLTSGAAFAGGIGGGYDLYATPAQSLTIDLDTAMLFEGAQLMIDALGGPYLLIAGFALGVAILGAVFSAIRSVRL